MALNTACSSNEQGMSIKWVGILILGMAALLGCIAVLESDDVGAATANPTYTDGDWGYDLVTEGGLTTAKIVSYSGSGGGAITIPTTIGGYTVTQVGKDASSGNNNVFESTLVATDLIIPDGILKINRYACQNLSNFTGTLSLGNTVTTLGYSCFSNGGFTGVLTLPHNITTINHSTGANGIFQGCNGFTELVIENGMSGDIGHNMFRNCTGFTGALSIPDSVTFIGVNAFSGCTGFTSLSIGSGVTTIYDQAFYNCTGMRGPLTIPNNVTTLGGYYSGSSEGAVFYRCGFDGALTIGTGVTEIPRMCFYMCSNLTTLTINGAVTRIGNATSNDDGVFYGCTGLTGNLTLPNTLTSIGQRAFYNCSGLSGPLVIPNGVTTIGSSAFYNCSGFTSLTLSNTLTEIKASTFSGCTSMTGDLVIPDSVTTIYYPYSSSASSPFYNCGFGGSLIIGDGLTAVGQYMFDGCVFNDNLVIGDSIASIPYGAFNCCRTATGTLTIGSGVQSIANNVFYQYKFTGSLVLPNGLTNIGDQAFAQCTGFTGSLVIPSTVTTIGVHSSSTSSSSGAFRGCTGLTGSIVIPDSVTLLGDRTFQGCTGLTGTLTIGTGITDINPYCFYDCKFTGNLNIPGNVVQILTYAFYDNTGFTSLTLQEGLDLIWTRAFYGCTGMAGVLAIPDSVTTLGPKSYANGCFYNCSGFTGLDLGDGVEIIGDTCFYNCTAMTGSLIIPDSVEYIGKGAFYECAFDGTLTIGNNVSEIGYGAFYSNSHGSFIGNLVIPDSVTVFGNPNSQGYQEAVFGYAGFTGSLTIGNGITVIPQGTFYGCGFTGTLTIGNNVTQIGSYDSNPGAFENVPLTGTLTIPDSVTKIMGRSFSGCSGFTTLSFGSGLTQITGYDAFRNCTGFTGALVIPDTVQYLGLKNTSGTSFVGGRAFMGCTGFTSLTIGENVELIGPGTFSGCTGFRGDLVIPDSVVEIGYGSYYNPDTTTPFYNCGFDGSLIIGDGLLAVYNYMFNGCAFQNDLVIGDSIAYIPISAFDSCRNCTGTLTLGNGLRSMDREVFRGYKFTGELILPEGMTELKYGAFRDCTGFTGPLVIPDSMITLGNNNTSNNDGVFQGCSGFTSLVLGNSLEMIGRSTFASCTGMTGDLIIPDSVTLIGYNAFAGCSFTSLDIGSGVTSIPGQAFYGNAFAGTLVIPDNIQTIANNAFYFNNDSRVDTLVLGRGLTSIGSYSFDTGGSAPQSRLDNIVALSDPTVGTGAFRNTTVSQILNLTGSDLVNVVPGNGNIPATATIRTDFEDTAMLQHTTETIVVDKEGIAYSIMRVIPIIMALAILIGVAYYIRGNKI